MQEIQSDIIIIGGGLTGLAAAYFLKEKNAKITILEARERLGGRIHTNYVEGQAPLETGATWFGRHHTSLLQLLEELEIGIFEQILSDRAIYEPISTSPHQLVALPPNNDPSFRIQGGSSVLIHTLAKAIDPEDIHLGEIVASIEASTDHLLVKTNHRLYKSKVVISTLPPNLFQSSITVTPSLPASFQQIAAETHTWMGESIKIGLRYQTPFWRKENSSGTIFSNVGPIPEMYDHSNVEESGYALKGFLNGAYYQVSKEERLAIILGQLRKYYGKEAEQLTDYEELIWRNEKFTYADYHSHMLPHQHNGHHVYQNSYLNGKLFVAGSETSTQYPGYMEGAIHSAKYVCGQIE